MKIQINTDKLTKEQAIKKIEDAYNDGICEYYHEREVCYYPTDYEKGYCVALGLELPKTKKECRCWGTKESEFCKCGGDRKRCDFYKN